MIFLPFYWWLKSKEGKLKFLIQSVWRLFTFTIYLRLIFEAYILLTIAGLFEIRYYIFDNSSSLKSMIIASVLILLSIILIIFSIFIWKSQSTKQSIDQSYWFKEFYSGIRNVRNNTTKTVKPKNASIINLRSNKVNRARLYMTIFLTRRLILVIMIVCIKDLVSVIFGILWFMVLQLVYILALIIIRPFEENKDNVSELINEFVFFILLSSMLHFHDHSKWNSAIEMIFIGFILSNNLIVSGIYMVYSVKNIILAIKKWRRKDAVRRFEPNNHSNTDHIVSFNDNQVSVQNNDRVLYSPKEDAKFDSSSRVSNTQLNILDKKKMRVHHREDL